MNIPLRTKEERLLFCDSYFYAVGANKLFQSENYREFELPIEVDKELTNRPFYWMWVEHTGQPITPTILRLAFDDEALERENKRLLEEALKERENRQLTDAERYFFHPPKAELLDLGSFRLDKIYSSIDLRGRFTSVIPSSSTIHTPLIPWIVMNGLFSYRCESNEQEWFSIGICLNNGQIIHDFFSSIEHIQMQHIEPEILLRQAEMPIEQGIETLKKHITMTAQKKPPQWAEAALERLNEEIAQIEMYYKSLLLDTPENEHVALCAESERKKRELIQRSSPQILIEWKQIGLFGLPLSNVPYFPATEINGK